MPSLRKCFAASDDHRQGQSTGTQGTKRWRNLQARQSLYSQSGDSVEGLFDPWGNPYTVLLDTDHDKLLGFKIASKDVEIRGRRVAVFSTGVDQKEGTGDDIRTW